MFLNLSLALYSSSTVTFYAALNTGNGDVLWSPILYVTSGRGSLLFFLPFIYSHLIEALL